LKLTTFTAAIGRYLLAFAALLGLGSLQTSAFAADPIYGVAIQGGFYKVDLTTGAPSLLGTIPVSVAPALAFKPGTSQLYGIVTLDGNTTFNVAQLSPETGTYTTVGPTIVSFDVLGGGGITDMTFAPDGTVYITQQQGRILKIDLVASTVTTIRGVWPSGSCGTFSSDYSCASGLAWLNGSLIQAEIGTGNNPAISGHAIQYLSVDPASGATTVLSTGSLPDTGAAYQTGFAWLDTEGGTLYLSAANNNGTVCGIADPYSATFTQLLGGFLAIIPTHFAISGQVTLGSVAFSGVTITLGGLQTGTATTDASGNYSFPNLLGTGSYTVAPSRSGYSFNPTNAALSTFSSDQTANFAGALIASPSLFQRRTAAISSRDSPAQSMTSR
jgi:hypothetical protein